MLPSFLRREDKRLPLFNLQAKAVSLLPDGGYSLPNRLVDRNDRIIANVCSVDAEIGNTGTVNATHG